MSQPEPITRTVAELLEALAQARRIFVGVETELLGGFPDSALAKARAGMKHVEETLGMETCPYCAQTFTPAFQGAPICNWCAGRAVDLANEL